MNSLSLRAKRVAVSFLLWQVTVDTRLLFVTHLFIVVFEKQILSKKKREKGKKEQKREKKSGELEGLKLGTPRFTTAST